jgi:hypothetical protein
MILAPMKMPHAMWAIMLAFIVFGLEKEKAQTVCI